MSFNSLEFMILLFITMVLYFIVPKKLQNPIILLSSYVFYAAYDFGMTTYIIIMTVLVYNLAIKLDWCHRRNIEKSKEQSWLVLGIVICLCPLLFYKYLNLAFSLINRLIGLKNEREFELLVPLGISFITFSLISYIVDIYRGTISAERSILKFALFVSFFPKVSQGPIVKAGDILPQFNEAHSFDLKRFRKGMVMTIYGLFMKMVVADNAGIAVDRIYGNLSAYSGAAVLLATALFAVQIYCDFAGYSYISIGIACVLGFEIKPNFRQPYLSISATEFWRRWHMSLNRWLTDYVYIPMGGKKCSKSRRISNILITFMISGLWHGATGGYFVWGLLNGIYVSAETMIRSMATDRKKNNNSVGVISKVQKSIQRLLQRIVTLLLIIFSWIFFRAQRCHVAIFAISRIFGDFNFSGFWSYARKMLGKGAGTSLYGLDVRFGIPVLLIGILVVFLVDVLADKYDINAYISNCNRIVRWTICYVLMFSIILFGVYGYGYSSGDFIYGNF